MTSVRTIGPTLVVLWWYVPGVSFMAAVQGSVDLLRYHHHHPHDCEIRSSDFAGRVKRVMP